MYQSNGSANPSIIYLFYLTHYFDYNTSVYEDGVNSICQKKLCLYFSY